jgi:hypothetical protein
MTEFKTPEEQAVLEAAKILANVRAGHSLLNEMDAPRRAVDALQATEEPEPLTPTGACDIYYAYDPKMEGRVRIDAMAAILAESNRRLALVIDKRLKTLGYAPALRVAIVNIVKGALP